MKDTNEIVKTNDGSYTVYSRIFNEHYHSINGAISESMHVFIEAGFNFIGKNNVSVLEIGFGTGLNVLLTFVESKKKHKKVNYITLEKYPLDIHLIKNLLNTGYFTDNQWNIFRLIHTAEWNKEVRFNSSFIFSKFNTDLLEYETEIKFDLIYFDAFSYDSQPELWQKEVFDKLYRLLNIHGVLTTYSAKGEVKRNLKSAGFEVERLSGAAGKRHMIRALKQ